MGKIIGNIYEERDYSKFKKLPDNRDVLSNRFSKLLASFSVKQIMNPIIVNENMQIIDGQGRYEVLKYLGRPIQYIVSKGTNSDDCKRMNRYNTKWSNLDFAKSYAYSGNENYINLLEACSKTNFSITRVIRLANRGKSTDNKNEPIIESGKLIFTKDDIKKVLDAKEIIVSVQETLNFGARLSDTFCIAIKIASDFKGYNHSHMLMNCKKMKNTFSLISGLEGMLKELERIYNYNTPMAQRLYFSDYMRNRGYNTRFYNEAKLNEYTDTNIQTLGKEN